MAGFYLILDKADQTRILNAVKAITNFDDEYTEIISEDYFTCVCSSVNDKELWGSAFDPISGTKVIISGRIHLSESKWNEAENLPEYEGGLAGKYIINKYLNNDFNSIYEFIGPALIIIWNPKARTLDIISDHFGYYPSYIYRNNKSKIKIISSSPDAISKDHNAKLTRDELSFVEFLSAWRITPPHTYYNEIKYLGAAKHYTFNLSDNSLNEKEYWMPFIDYFYDDFELASKELEAALRDSIGKITLARLGPIINFTSGGMDSRVVLFSAAERNALIGFNLYDEPNLESSIAQQLCEECNVRYYGFKRDADYYPRLMRQIVNINNGMNAIDDQHYLGTREVIKELGARTVISGCSTDWLFKGYGLEKKYRQLFGKNLPLTKLTKNRIDVFLPNYSDELPKEYKKQIKERLLNWFGDVPKNFIEDRDWLQVEDKRIRPILYAPSISGPSMYRIFPYDTFLASSKIADVYGKMPAKWKINSNIWSKTVERIGGKAGKVVDVNSGSRMGIGLLHSLYDFSRGWVRRHMLQKEKFSSDQLATNYSWPNFDYMIKKNSILRSEWFKLINNYQFEVKKYCGLEFNDDSISHWKGNHHLFFRIITLLLWFDKE
jgi:hypothetical protein